MYGQIDYAVQDRVLTITLDRPDRLNAYTATMMRELIHAFERADADDDVRAIVVTGAGRAFCAGADLSGGGATFDALLPAAYAIAHDIADNTAPISAALSRQMLSQALGWTHPMDAHRIESRGVYATGRMSDAREGVTSFLEKRPPVFAGSVANEMPDFFPWFNDPAYS